MFGWNYSFANVTEQHLLSDITMPRGPCLTQYMTVIFILNLGANHTHTHFKGFFPMEYLIS